MRLMGNRFQARLATVVCALTVVPVGLPFAPAATAAPCPDAEVVFARGTHEPDGLGEVGQGFVDALGPRLGGRSLGVYAVEYPAEDDYFNSTVSGGEAARDHILRVVAECPTTRIVLGGYSQGAAVASGVTSVLPPEVASHVVAVALFGAPTSGLSAMLAGGADLPTVNPAFTARTIDLCIDGDPICSSGMDLSAHTGYVAAGMTDQAADYAAARIVQ